ncbi:MAG TPA: DeoR/GlpR family DNA-binding transcription regulator [Oculatellaceae cyanobacterium]
MLTKQRQQLILQRLSVAGLIVAKELSAELDTSEDTIRRDLRELASQGLLVRVHGGALPRALAGSALPERATLSLAAKAAMAKKALAFIHDGQTIFLDGGTTTLELARQMRPDMRITVITHSVTVGAELVNNPSIELILLGGKIFKHSGVAVGSMVVEAIAAIKADVFFLGATGVHFQSGVTTGDMEESHIKRALMLAAGETILMVSPEKINAVSAFKIAELGEISTLIVNEALPANLRQALKKNNVQVSQA